MRYDVIFILAALLCLLTGVCFGLYFMSSGGDLSYLPAHAHFNLFGWVTLALYGLMHRAYPNLAAAKLAPAHILAIGGGVLLPLGFALPENYGHVAIGALSGALAVIAFTIMFAGKARAT